MMGLGKPYCRTARPVECRDYFENLFESIRVVCKFFLAARSSARILSLLHSYRRSKSHSEFYTRFFPCQPGLPPRNCTFCIANTFHPGRRRQAQTLQVNWISRAWSENIVEDAFLQSADRLDCSK